jgi:hypothetical protein
VSTSALKTATRLPAQTKDNPFTQFIGILPPLPNNQNSLEFWREMRGHEPDDHDL